MVIMHTAPYMVYDRVSLDFSEDEKKRIEEILDELRDIFMAQSVGLSQELSYSGSEDYKIIISGCPVRNKYN